MTGMSRSTWIATALLVVSFYTCLSLRQRWVLEVRFAETVRRKNSVAAVNSNNNKDTGKASTTVAIREKTWLHNSDHQLLLPLRVLQDYKSQHSADVLAKESNEQLLERKYAVTGYSCPYRMGNIWHSYFNSIIWAIITNRTIVVRYDTRAKKAPLHDCQKVAMQAQWLPDFETIQQRLISVAKGINLESPNVTIALTSDQVQDLADLFVGASLFHTSQRVENGGELVDDETSSRLQRALRDFNSYHAVLFPLIGGIQLNEDLFKIRVGGWSTGSPYTMRKHFDYNDLLLDDTLKDPVANSFTSSFSSSPQHWLLSSHDIALLQLGRARARDLFDQSFHFLFGMIFRECFDVLVTPNPSTPIRQQDAYTVALHSRHVVFEDDGSIVVDEVACLQKFLKQIASWEANRGTKRAKDCQVILMSDRQNTIDKLSDWLLHHTNCTPIVHVHDDLERKDRDGIKEHGDFAGGGFMAELEVAVQARTGVIGNLRDGSFRGGRSSTAFLMELIEYDRRTEANARGEDVSGLPDLFHCQLPGKGVNGYTVGNVSFKKNESTAFWGKKDGRQT